MWPAWRRPAPWSVPIHTMPQMLLQPLTLCCSCGLPIAMYSTICSRIGHQGRRCPDFHKTCSSHCKRRWCRPIPKMPRLPPRACPRSNWIHRCCVPAATNCAEAHVQQLRPERPHCPALCDRCCQVHLLPLGCPIMGSLPPLAASPFATPRCIASCCSAAAARPLCR